ncbi:MAG: BrnA antitoxin family protein, partial [Planctomycetota bacterium]|nr:BrnA antitoxin family protein [Planctomycetota bacterium]
VRIDTDILAWLKTYGKGYQTKINAILRREMFAAKSGYQPQSLDL